MAIRPNFQSVSMDYSQLYFLILYIFSSSEIFSFSQEKGTEKSNFLVPLKLRYNISWETNTDDKWEKVSSHDGNDITTNSNSTLFMAGRDIDNMSSSIYTNGLTSRPSMSSKGKPLHRVRVRRQLFAALANAFGALQAGAGGGNFAPGNPGGPALQLPASVLTGGGFVLSNSAAFGGFEGPDPGPYNNVGIYPFLNPSPPENVKEVPGPVPAPGATTLPTG